MRCWRGRTRRRLGGGPVPQQAPRAVGREDLVLLRRQGGARSAGALLSLEDCTNAAATVTPVMPIPAAAHQRTGGLSSSVQSWRILVSRLMPFFSGPCQVGQSAACPQRAGISRVRRSKIPVLCDCKGVTSIINGNILGPYLV